MLAIMPHFDNCLQIPPNLPIILSFDVVWSVITLSPLKIIAFVTNCAYIVDISVYGV
jgi:hypothetical protein